jgi:phosphate transport system protein
MGHYEERLEKSIKEIEDLISSIRDKVLIGVRDSQRTLLEQNDQLGFETILADKDINRLVKKLDQKCHSFTVRHLPAGRHLRFISSAMRVGIELERIGDYATTICREAVSIPTELDGEIKKEVEILFSNVISALEKASQSFLERNTDLVAGAIELCKETTSSFDNIFSNLQKRTKQFTQKELFELLIIFLKVLRIGDQARNICDETLFAVTGETSEAKKYSIIFLDENNSCMGKLAEAIANKNFSGCAAYSSSGKSIKNPLHPHLLSFLDQHDLEINNSGPQILDEENISDNYLIITLQGKAKNYIKRIPFHSISFEWELGELPDMEDEAKAHERMFEIYRELNVRVGDLMIKLCGEGISRCN